MLLRHLEVNMSNKVSAIITTYNRAKLVMRAVHSVLGQTFSDYEVIVVDDGSSDNTRKVLEPMISQGKVRYFYQANRGGSAARNLGIYKSRGKFLAFLDDDDVWMSEKLEEQIIAFNQYKDIGVVHTDYLIENEGGQITSSPEKAYRNSDQFEEELLFRNVVWGSASSAMIKKECFDSVGLFDEELVIADHEMWLRIAQQFRFHYIEKPLVTISYQNVGNKTDLDTLTKGRHQYVKKLFQESKTEKFRYLNKNKAYEVAYFIYFDIAQQYFAKNRYLKSSFHLLSILGLGPKFIFRLIRDSFQLANKKFRRLLRSE